jgi:membrane protein DedA with SNARE-associated domain
MRGVLGRGKRTWGSPARGAATLIGVSSHEITHLIHEYGLIVVFLAAGLQAVCFPIPGGTALVAGGIDASTKHGLPVVWVIVAGALGALVGTTIAYWIGRWRGDRVLLRLGKLFRRKPERVEELRAWFQNHGVAPVFIARFITGARNLAGLVSGATGMPFPRFFAVSVVACALWSTIITLEYYFAGHVILGAPTWLQILLIVLGIVGTIVSFRLLKPAVESKVTGSADGTDTDAVSERARPAAATER